MKWLGLIIALLLAACQRQNNVDEIAEKLAAAQESTAKFADVQADAWAGDYQAQRNLAYGFAAAPYPGQEKNAVLGCAWYLVIKHYGHPQFDASDESNVNVYCGKLDEQQLDAAKVNAQKALGQMKGKSS